jgi:sialate O-acetylesterase
MTGAKNMTTMVALIVALASFGVSDAVPLAGDYQVIQRGPDDTGACFAPLGMDVPAGALIKFSVTRYGRPITSGEKKADAALPKDQAGVEVAALKPGGPYCIDVTATGRDGAVVARAKFDNILVGDLWVLAGQSNMAGSAPIKERLAPDPLVNMLGMDGVWKPGVPPTHRMVESDSRAIKDLLLGRGGVKSEEQLAELAKQSLTGENPWGGASCDTFFAAWLAKETGIPQGLIPTAFGGTSLEEWSPDLLSRGDASLYGNMIRSITRSGGHVRGMLWYQGESDAMNGDPKIYDTYFDRFKRFVECTRRDSNNPEMVFITAQLGRVVIMPWEAEPRWDGLREQQRRLAMEVPGVHMVPAADLALSDGIHVGWDGHKRLGVRMARVALPHVTSDGDRPGIALASVCFGNAERSTIKVDFNYVVGNLHAERLPSGFTLTLPDQPARDLFFKIEFEADHPNRVVLCRGGSIDPAAKLSYGQGLNPILNITDGDDMAPCSFGPVAIAAFEEGK